MNPILLEKLAALEHEQWASWARHVLPNANPGDVAKWTRQIETPYVELAEAEKESDREWARRVLAILANGAGDQTLIAEGRFLALKHIDTWEYVERKRSTGVVAILAITDENNILLIEQVRRAIGKVVVEIPAGLAGDIAGSETEELANAAQRELLEETGYEAEGMEYLTRGPSSAGITNEMITFFRAHGLTRTSHRIGDGSEEITVHEVPLDNVDSWLLQRSQLGHEIDPKIYSVLYFANQRRGQ